MQFFVNLVQMPTLEGDRERNFDRARSLLRPYRAHDGVDFIVLPELFAIGFRREDYEETGPGIPGPTSEFLSEIAESKEAFVVATGIERSPERFYNTLVMVEPGGETMGTYRKIHPFQEERDVFDGGDTITLFECEGIKVGVQICYDIRFPEVSRRLALEGAELFIIPAAFPDPRAQHWNALLQARAIENQVYVAAANRMGMGYDGKTYFGHSQVIDPWGVVMTRINSEERVVFGSGDTSMIETVRNQITCYADRSPSGYDRVRWYRTRDSTSVK
ncbi:MAG: nitrilase-related carbon-nitrogen hydrolase [Candidatus Thorarchaeota archaeon]|nr:MAG: carbon-nitrogen family hydrolase [Candidatus Thorarchaeota archaeon]